MLTSIFIAIGGPVRPIETPPYMRVRVRRVRELRAFDESRKTERIKVSDGKRVREGRTLRQMPGTAWATRRLRGEVLADPGLT